MTTANPPGRMVDEFVIPATFGRAFVVKKGQTFRIHQVDPRGGQVGDCAFFNANDTKEVFHCGQSWSLNQMAGTGNSKSFKHFWSKPPRENIMLTTVADTYADHWGNMGGRCSKRIYEIRSGLTQPRSCQHNITEAIEPFGLTGDDVIDIFNVFMSVKLDGDGNFTIQPSRVTFDDYIDMRAEMDVLAAISACPAVDSPTNNHRSSPLGIRIYE